MKLHNLILAAGIGVISVGAPSIALAMNCTLSPEYSVIAEGQAVDVSLTCDAPIASAEWKLDGVSLTGQISLSQTVPTSVTYTTPVALGSGSGQYTLRVDTTDGASQPDTGYAIAKIFVKPAGGLLAGSGANSLLTPVNGQCGNANNSAVTSMPTGADQCASGKASLAITAPTSFSWSCLSPNGGTDANCFATRGYVVTTAVNGGNGTISPSQSVVSGNVAVVTAAPVNGYSALFPSNLNTCGGAASGNTYTTGPINAPCTVTAEFANLPVNGACGTAQSQLATSSAALVNLCSAGAASSITTGTSVFTWSCQGSNGGTTANNCQSARGYGVTPSAAGGSISPSVVQTVAYNDTQQFSLTPTVSTHRGKLGSGNTCGGTVVGATYTTAAITGSCNASIEFAEPVVVTTDPGKGTGLWMPPTLPTGGTNTGSLIVVDQSNAGGVGSISYIPGCMNYRNATTSGCRWNNTASDSLNGTPFTVTLANGNTIAIRYTSTATAGVTKQRHKVTNSLGGDVNVSMTTSVSTVPGDFSVSGLCQATSSIQPTVYTGVQSIPFLGTTNYCPLRANTAYYINMKVNSGCSTGCTFAIDENSDLQ